MAGRWAFATVTAAGALFPRKRNAKRVRRHKNWKYRYCKFNIVMQEEGNGAQYLLSRHSMAGSWDWIPENLLLHEEGRRNDS